MFVNMSSKTAVLLAALFTLPRVSAVEVASSGEAGDGSADGLDFLIWQQFFGMEHCASRFEGDADQDGDVDQDDLAIWEAEKNTQISAAVCGCAGGGQVMTAADGIGLALLPEDEAAMAGAAPGDADGDADFDEDDMQYWLRYYGAEQ